MNYPFYIRKRVSGYKPNPPSFIIPTVIFLFFLLLSSSSLAAIYYVDATNGGDTNTGLSQATPWKTIAKINNSNFSSGDQILFKCGEIWREQLTVPSSGSPGNPITFGTYGSGVFPIISGSNLISSGWTQYSSTVYEAVVTFAPKQVFFNGVRGTPVASAAAIVAASEWYWASNVLYVYSTSNPNIAFTSPGIEASQFNYNIEGNGQSYLVFQNLDLEEANQYGLIFHVSTASNVVVNGVMANKAYYSGISSGGSTAQTYVTVENCTTSWNGGSGIEVDTPSNYWTIQNNQVFNNSQVYNSGDTNTWYTGGIKSWAGNALVQNIVVQGNTVYNQGVLPDGSLVNITTTAAGIWFDTNESVTWTGGPLITKNNVYRNAGCGILLESTSYATASYNLVHDNNLARANDWGIRATDWHYANPASGNRIYNNVVYGNSNGIQIAGSQGQQANRCSGNQVINNIVLGNGPGGSQFVAAYGGENDRTMGSGNIYIYNCFGPQGTNFIGWGNAIFMNSYAAWYAAYPAANGNTIQVAPLFVDVSTPDFHLQSTSPCINAGINVGLTTDYAGNPVPDVPDIGAYEFVAPVTSPTGLRLY